MQIHGHDFACLAVLPKASPPCYASGSEEKVIRVLEAPQAYEDTIALGRSDEVHASSSSAHHQVRFLAPLKISACAACVMGPLFMHNDRTHAAGACLLFSAQSVAMCW